MKLSLTLLDERVKADTYAYTSSPKTEEFTRVEIADSVANNKVIAAILRGIADEIDAPPSPSAKLTFRPSDRGLLRGEY